MQSEPGAIGERGSGMRTPRRRDPSEGGEGGRRETRDLSVLGA